MSTVDALSFLSTCMDKNVGISTVDGYHVVGDKFREDVDLMFAPESDGIQESIEEAIRFIKANDAPGIVWELWPEWRSELQ